MSECIAGGNKVCAEQRHIQIDGEPYKLENTEWELLTVQPGSSFYKETMRLSRIVLMPNKPKLRNCKVWTGGNPDVGGLVLSSAKKQGYRVILDSIPDYIGGIVFDEDGGILYCNTYKFFDISHNKEETIKQFLNGGSICE